MNPEEKTLLNSLKSGLANIIDIFNRINLIDKFLLVKDLILRNSVIKFEQEQAGTGIMRMDENGDLFWKDTAGVEVQLNLGAPTTTTYKALTGTRDGDAASGTQNFAHGLAVVPKFVSISAIKGFTSTDIVARSEITYNGTTRSGQYSCIILGTPDATVNQSSDIIIIDATDGSVKQQGVLTWDATNIILTWTKTGAPSANSIYISINVIAEI